MKIFLSLLLLTVGIADSAPSARQDLDPSMKMRKVIFIGPPSVFFSNLARDYAVTVGLEALPEGRQIKVEAEDADLADLLDAAVRADPRYRWRRQEGAVDVLPAGGKDSPLDAEVEGFRVEGVRQREAIDMLMSSPGVLSALRARGLTPAASRRAEEEGRVFSLSLGHVTARAALHEIVKRSGTRFWLARELDGKAYWVGTPQRWRPSAR